MLYNIVIRPIEYLIEVIYVVMERFLGQPAYAILAVSILVSVLTTPLYRRAEQVQKAQRKKEESLERWSAHIRKSFRGDERYMLMSAYYHIMDYHPYEALKGAIPLLLQIPFFIAAYHFLSHLNALSGASFLFLADLGAEDAILGIHGMRFNLLPLVMSLVNLLSAAIYTRDFALKDRLQPMLLALVFLILLYHSPSGLVLYWTMNNIFSLGRNVIGRFIKDKGRFFACLCILLTALYYAFLFSHGVLAALLQKKDNEAVLLLFIIGLLPLFYAVTQLFSLPVPRLALPQDKQGGGRLLVACELALTLLLGLWLPMSVIASSPLVFVNVTDYRNPLHFVFFCVCVSAGIFLFWGGIFYALMNEYWREIFSLLLFSLLLIFALDAFFFKADVGVLSITIQFEHDPSFGRLTRLVNILAIGFILWLVFFVLRNKRRPLTSLAFIFCLALTFLSAYKSRDVLTQLKIYKSNREQERSMEIPLSTTGKNVVLIMLDRAVGTLLPFCFEDRPELYEQFDGFTYYPNTVSGGTFTLFGSTAIYGGYEYAPLRINERSDELLVDKQNEALKVLPVLFDEAGYKVSVNDPTLAGLLELSDLSIYDAYPNINAFHYRETMNDGVTYEESIALTERNLLFYALLRSLPAMFQYRLYDGGMYLSAGEGGLTSNPRLMRSYMELASLADITRITTDAQNTFLMMRSDLPHRPTVLQLPDYTIPHVTDNTAFDQGPRELTAYGRSLTLEGLDSGAWGIAHYHANMATYILLGKWLDSLKEAGVYDNTRILFVSDHGYTLGQFPELFLSDGSDMEGVNALLMVKDFDQHGKLVFDESFMTNADSPGILLKDLLDEPKNPFSGEEINDAAKADGYDLIYTEHTDSDSAYIYRTEDEKWYHVSPGAIDDADNWTRIK